MTGRQGNGGPGIQAEAAAVFEALHRREGTFVIANAWDPGSARILAGLGFEALATTSAGYAFSRGRLDGTIDRDEMLAHARDIVSATDLPVSADLENGYGDTPEDAAQTIRLAAAAGLSGASIEDTTISVDARVPYEVERAAERVRAAVDARRGLALPFMLTARCENFLIGRPDLADTIRRLQAYQEAGADVLYAPGLSRLEDIASVVASVDRPVNVLALASLSVEDLARAGVRRISIGSGFARAAIGALVAAGREIRERGTFEFARTATPYAAVKDLLDC